MDHGQSDLPLSPPHAETSVEAALESLRISESPTTNQDDPAVLGSGCTDPKEEARQKLNEEEQATQR